MLNMSMSVPDVKFRKEEENSCQTLRIISFSNCRRRRRLCVLDSCLV